MSTAFDFSGGGLSFRVTGPGVSIDPVSGLLSIDTGQLLDGVEIVVTASNAGGTVTSRFRLTVAVLPAEGTAPVVTGSLADVVLVHGGTGARVAAAAAFVGTGLGFAVSGGGATVDAATGDVGLSAEALRAGEEVRVTATNASGSATAAFRVTVAPAAAAPVAVPGALTDLDLVAGRGIATVSTQAAFAGTGLAYALASAPQGVTIDPATGRVAIDTGAPETGTAAAEVVVRAANAAGAAQSAFRLTRRPGTTDFATAGALGALTFIGANAGLVGFTGEAAQGLARLVTPASGRVHSRWAHAPAGEGRFRALARWTAPNATATPYSPFLLGHRVGVDAAGNWRGLVLEVLQPAGGARRLRLLAFSGSGSATTSLASADLDWAWDSWSWVELELSGTAIRGRLHPEAGPVPDWQVTGVLPAATLSGLPAEGASGPAALPQGGQSPVVELRRLETLPLTLDPARPAPAAAADWAIAQINLQA